MLNKRYIKSIERDILSVLISFPVFLFQFLFCYIWKEKIRSGLNDIFVVSISILF